VASHINVILIESIDKLGKAGALVRVKPGYARNYLIPQGLAVQATSGQVARMEHERTVVMARIAKNTKEAEAVAEKLSGLVLEVEKPAGEGEKLYGSVTAMELSEALKARGIEIDRKKLELPGAIKRLGEFEIKAKLGREVTADFKLVVRKQE
jgi:large subunit ribosomal protein L9